MRLLMFPGQGTQTPGMGKDVYERYSSAKRVFEQVDDALGFSISNIIFNGDKDTLIQTDVAQVAIMTTSIAYLRACEEQLDVPLCNENIICAGHSLGEYSALCAAGALSIEDTARLLWVRGNAMKSCSSIETGMAAVLGADLDTVNSVIDRVKSEIQNELVIQIANDNSIGQVVISGHKLAIEKFVEHATNANIKKVVSLNVSGAFHSEIMKDAAEKMKQVLESTNFKEPICPVFSNYTAQPATSGFADLLYKQITGAVRWREILLNAVELGVDEALEIGPGSVLAGLAKRTTPQIIVKNINSVDAILNQ